jgi:hypothetical protein
MITRSEFYFTINYFQSSLKNYNEKSVQNVPIWHVIYFDTNKGLVNTRTKEEKNIRMKCNFLYGKPTEKLKFV